MLSQEERALPALAPTDVLIKVRATGLCGSDLHYFSHFRNGDIQVRQPLTLGHESAGTVTAVGADVTHLAPGDHVALEVGLPCRTCALCAQGRYNICKAMSFRSSAKSFPHAQGTLQDLVAHPAAFVHKLPPSVPLELGALVEPLSVAMHAGDRARLPDSATVLVLGAGAVGLLCCAVSKVLGARRVVVADINADRVRWAREKGFADGGVVVPMKRPEGIDAKLEFAKEVAALVGSELDGGEVDVTFECTGVESCLQAAIYVSLRLVERNKKEKKQRGERERERGGCQSERLYEADACFTGYATRRQDLDYRHGQPDPDAAHISRLAQGGRLGRRLSLCKHLSQGH